MNNIEALNIIANILQIYNTILLQQDVSNNEIINRLDRLEALLVKNLSNNDNISE